MVVYSQPAGEEGAPAAPEVASRSEVLIGKIREIDDDRKELKMRLQAVYAKRYSEVEGRPGFAEWAAQARTDADDDVRQVALAYDQAARRYQIYIKKLADSSEAAPRNEDL